MKVIRFKITAIIPMKDKTQDEIEDDLIEAMESIGSRFTSWIPEIEEEDDD